MKNTNTNVPRGHLPAVKAPMLLAAWILFASMSQAQNVDEEILSDTGFNTGTQPMDLYTATILDRWLQENASLQTGPQPDGVSPHEGDGMVCLAQSLGVVTQVRQRIDVTALSGHIDAGGVTIAASGWVNASTSGVVGGICVHSLDAGQAYTASTNGYLNLDGATGSWEPTSATLLLPPNTRYVEFQFLFDNNSLPLGERAYGDAASLVLSNPCTTVPHGVSLWLPLDETSGTISNNAVGGNDGTHIASPTPITGKVDGGIHLGGGATVDVPHYPALDVGTGDFSIDLWVRQDNTSFVNNVLVQKGTNPGFKLYLLGNTLALDIATSVEAFRVSNGDIPLDGNWHLVAVTLDRGQTNGLRFYIDGVLVTAANGISGSLGNSEPLIVGPFDGAVDEVEMFSRALSETEVQALYDAGSSGKCKESCALPWDAAFCVNQNSITVNAKFCNWTSQSQVYVYSFEGLPVGPGCTIPGPTGFSPASGAILVLPGKCTLLPVTINRPAGMVAQGQIGCYELTATSTSGRTVSCVGSVQDTRELCASLPTDYVDIDLQTPVDIGPVVVSGTPAAGLQIAYSISALDDSMQPDDGYVSLNGLPPGQPVTGLFDMTMGTDMLGLTAEFVAATAIRHFSVVLEADTNNDGTFEVLGSIGLLNVLGGSSSGPANESCFGDGGDQMGCTDCPCGNNAPIGSGGGCLNSVNTSAVLHVSGVASASADTLHFDLTGAVPGFALLFSGGDQLPNNAVNPCFGLNSGVQSIVFDGLRCVGNGVIRHSTRAINANGDTNNGWGPPAAPSNGLIADDGLFPGQTRHFQCVYRELPTVVCMTGQNTSQAISVTIVP